MYVNRLPPNLEKAFIMISSWFSHRILRDSLVKFQRLGGAKNLRLLY
jgi:hypothetical protein